MKDYFTRQTAWFEQMLSDLETLEKDLNDPELEKVDEQRRIHTEKTENLAGEFQALYAEWEAATDLAEEERAEVRRLSRRAAELAAQLRATHDQALGTVHDRLENLSASLNKLRRGRDMLQKYRPGQSTDATFVDKKA